MPTKKKNNKTNKPLTFGIEIEFYTKAYEDDLESIFRKNKLSNWIIDDDGSIDPMATEKADSDWDTYEIKSPILSGTNGINQVKKVAKILKQIGAKVNGTCGFHVHIGANHLKPEQIVRLAKAYHFYENDIDNFLAFNRRKNENHYARPMKEYAANLTKRLNKDQFMPKKWVYDGWSGFRGKLVDDPSGDPIAEIADAVPTRYAKLNLKALVDHGTVEFRQHEGTVDEKDMVHWIRFCLNFVKRFSKEKVLSKKKNVLVDLPKTTAEHLKKKKRKFNRIATKKKKKAKKR